MSNMPIIPPIYTKNYKIKLVQSSICNINVNYSQPMSMVLLKNTQEQFAPKFNGIANVEYHSCNNVLPVAFLA